nr:hypothetical protein [Tanacetum cinerariifolium]
MMIRENKNDDELRLNMHLLQEKREATAIKEAKYRRSLRKGFSEADPKDTSEQPTRHSIPGFAGSCSQSTPDT